MSVDHLDKPRGQTVSLGGGVLDKERANPNYTTTDEIGVVAGAQTQSRQKSWSPEVWIIGPFMIPRLDPF